MTLTDGDYSFEQALFSAGLIAHEADGPLLVMGADEYHEKLTPLFDASAACAIARRRRRSAASAQRLRQRH